MAEILDFTLEINGIDKTIKSVEDLEQSIKDLQNTIKSNVGRGVLDNTELEKNLARLEKLRLEAKATREAIKQTSVDGARSMGTLREAFDGAGAAAEILSGENDKVGRVVMTVMKAIGVANSAREVSENKSTIAIISNRVATQANIVVQKLYDSTLKGSVVSLNAFKMALATTGIGLIVVALGSLVYYLSKTKDETDDLTKSQDALNKSLADTPGSIEYAERKLKAFGATEADLAKKRNIQNLKDKKDIEDALAANKKAQEGLIFTSVNRVILEDQRKSLEEKLDLIKTKIREQDNIINDANKVEIDTEKEKSDDIVDINRQRYDAQLSLMNQYYGEEQLNILQSATTETEKENELLALEIKRMEDELILRRRFFQDTTDLEIRIYNAKKGLINKEKSDREKNLQDARAYAEKIAESSIGALKKLQDNHLKMIDYVYATDLRLLTETAKGGQDISKQRTNLEIKRLEKLREFYKDDADKVFEIDLELADKRKGLRDQEHEMRMRSVEAGFDLLRSGVQASMDLEAQRTENALANQNLTEEEREKIARASFEKQKKLQLQMAYVDAAKSITSIISQTPKFDGGILMGLLLATSAVSNAAAITRIKRTQYQPTGGSDAEPGKFARGGVLVGPLHSQGGIRTSFGELEGGEFVVNRRSTRMYGGLISAINQAGGGRKYATGGILGLEDQLQSLQSRMNQAPVVKAYVLEGDISSAMEAEQKIKYRTSL